MDLEDVKIDKENELKFLLLPESKSNDVSVIDNMDEYDLWLSLWQKLQYNLSITLTKAGINKWQETHTLYFMLPVSNDKQQNNNKHFNCLLIKSVNDLIDIAQNSKNFQQLNQKINPQQCRMVLKLKVSYFFFSLVFCIYYICRIFLSRSGIRIFVLLIFLFFVFCFLFFVCCRAGN